MTFEAKLRLKMRMTIRAKNNCSKASSKPLLYQSIRRIRRIRSIQSL